MASFFKRGAGDYSQVERQTMLSRELETRMNGGLLKDRKWSTESFAQAAETGTVPPDLMAVEQAVRTAYDTAYGAGGYDKLTDGQRDAALCVLARYADGATGLDNPTTQFRTLKPGISEGSGAANEAYTTTFGMPEAAVGVAPFDYQFERRGYAKEVFDDRQLENFVRISAAFHIAAAKQTPAAEAMYETYSMPADTNGFTIEVERPLVFNQIYHGTDGTTTDFNRHRKLLLNAYQDYTILQNTVHEVKPYFIEDNAANNQFFVDKTKVAPTIYGTAPDENFLTSWYKPGIKFSVIGLGQNPARAASGKADTSDTIDHRGTLDKILMTVTGPAGVSYIPFDTEHLAYSQFQVAQEGQNRRMLLNFETQDLVISANTVDVTGAAPAVLSTFKQNYPDYRVVIGGSISGTTNLESSETHVASLGDFEIKSIFKVIGTGVDAQVVAPDDATYAAIAALFTGFELLGFKLKNYYTYFNRSETGPLVTNERYRDCHIVPLGAPITAQIPVVEQANTSIDLNTPAQTLMIRNSNNAFSQLFTFEKVLEKAQLALSGHDATVPQIRAIGRWILRRTWYDAQAINLTAAVQSLQTADRNSNIGAVIANKLRFMVNRGFYHTNFQAAMNVLGVGVGTKPKIRIVCNPIVANYIMTQGDSRTLGDGWIFDIVEDQDGRLIDRDANGNPIYRVYAFFSVDGVTGPHPLKFGNMIYKPDVVTQLPIQRNGRTRLEFTAQPWTLHVNHCPVLFRLDIAGLPEATGDNIPFAVSPR